MFHFYRSTRPTTDPSLIVVALLALLALVGLVALVALVAVVPHKSTGKAEKEKPTSLSLCDRLKGYIINNTSPFGKKMFSD